MVRCWWTRGAQAHRTCTPRQLDPVAKECQSHTWGRLAIYGGAKLASCRSKDVLCMQDITELYPPLA